MQGRHLTIGILAVLAAAQLAAGTLVLVRQLGEVPRYGDSTLYLWLSGGHATTPERAALYPRLIRGVDWLQGHERALPRRYGYDHPQASEGLQGLQITQILVCVASLAYFLHAALDWSQLGGFRRVGFLLALGLLTLDPLLLHFALAVMADSLALSGSLVFCAALADLGRRRISPWLAGPLLVAAQLLAGGVRIEKNAVMLATAAATAIAFAWAGRRGRGPAGIGRRGFVALALAGAAFAVVQAGQSWAHEGRSATTMIARILQQRIVFPHLSDIRESLPPSVQRQISQKDAKRFDSSIIATRVVMLQTSGGNSAKERQLSLVLTRTALLERGPAIAFDMAKDCVDNVFATISFYARLGALETLKPDQYRWLVRHSGTESTRKQMTMFAPRLVRAQLAVSAALLVLAAAAALGGWRRLAKRGVPSALRDTALAWLPIALFWLANSAAFACTQDLLLVRYALFSHAVLLALVVFGALCWSLDAGGEAGSSSGPRRSSDSRV